MPAMQPEPLVHEGVAPVHMLDGVSNHLRLPNNPRALLHRGVGSPTCPPRVMLRLRQTNPMKPLATNPTAAWGVTGIRQPWCRQRRSLPHHRWIQQQSLPSLGMSRRFATRTLRNMFVIGCSWTFGFVNQMRSVTFGGLPKVRHAARSSVCLTRTHTVLGSQIESQCRVAPVLQMFNNANVLMATQLG